MSLRVFTRKFSAGRQLRAVLDEQFTPDKLKGFNKPGKLIAKKCKYYPRCFFTL